MQNLTVVTEQHTDRTTISVYGEVDLQTCPELARAASLGITCGTALHLDLSGVPFMDSSGLNLLILLHHRLQAEGGRLAVTGLQTQPAHLLRLTGTHELLTVGLETVGSDTPAPRQP
ncbi:STAS domain-containing protein [Streptomyces sp. NPDC047017]|uniref:STAS domain-containing protein n=1 Tax=Streptomyces sp. NPDC047017 TaxID=3155024 RepID=UPI0033FAF639